MASEQAVVGQRLHMPKMAELIGGSLRRQIVRGELQAGDALPSEAALMEQFGVSRPTLREAFRVLESESLITIRRGAHGGARVRSPDGALAARYAGLVLEYRGTRLGDVYKARTEIEGSAARLAAGARTPEDLERLNAVYDEITEETDDLRRIALHEAFDAAIVETSANQTLVVLSQILRGVLDTATTEAVASSIGEPFAVKAYQEAHLAHRRLIDLIEAGDGERAEAHWRRHLILAEEFVMKTGVSSKSVLDLL